MIVEIGHFALVLALCVALVQSSLPLIGAHRGDRAWIATAVPAATAQLGCVALAFAALLYAHVSNDFSVETVLRNSHSAKPLLYRITGLWGNHEGSMLLWMMILVVFGAAVAWFGSNLPAAFKARVLAVQGMIGAGFLLFILAGSDPFTRVLPAPLEGQDLNPLLQDPGLAFHPPFLYGGYVGFSMAFSFAVAALIEGRVDPSWARWVRPWTLLAWTLLTIGIALGSWWAYYVLGWGGWWAWDPVENASFMPWLAGTALLHSAIVVEKRDALKSWTVLLAILTFSLSLLGTFLVRSGVLTSVHAFAVDPTRGVLLLGLLLVLIGGPLLLYAVRAPVLKAGGLFQPVSREGSLVLNNILLSAATFAILLGTLYPLFADAVGAAKVSVGPPFFNTTFVPIMVVLILAMAAGPLLPWKRAQVPSLLQRLRPAALGGFAVGFAAWLFLVPRAGSLLLTALGLGLGAWLILGSATEFLSRLSVRQGLGTILSRARGLPRSTWGALLGHGGLGVMILGITVSIAFQAEAIQVLRPGGFAVLAGDTYVLERVESGNGPNYQYQRARLNLLQPDGRGVLRPVAVLTPERRFYPSQQTTTTNVAIRTNGLSDRYAALGDPVAADGTPVKDGQPADGWVIRLYLNPLVPWIWFGAGIMALGGILSLTDRRLRIGVPARQRRTTPVDLTVQA